MMITIRHFWYTLAVLFSVVITAQDTIRISGLVTDSQGNPLSGASVVLKNTNTGVQTDISGNYDMIEVPGNGTLIFSYVGFLPIETLINGQTIINVSLQDDTQTLDEVVVIGYGELKIKDLTSAITTVDSEELGLAPVGQPMQALQGRVSGLQIVNNGSPGQSPTVRVRGVGSYNLGASTPLFVVDGAFFDDVDFLNPSDITSISVLKDASAAAIYGVRAANGVIIIETKSGRLDQKPQISYNGYTGFQVAQNVLIMANSEQFTTLALESGSDPDVQFILNTMQRYGRSRVNPSVPDVNTDWYHQILRRSLIQNHNLSMIGGSHQATYAISANYFGQEGILKMKNEYERFNLRSKVDFQVNDWLKVGGSMVFSNATRYDPENSAWRLAYYAVPLLPVLDLLLLDDQDVFPKNYANAQSLGYRGGQNPFPTMDFSENRSKTRNALANFYAEIDLIREKLMFKTAYNHHFEGTNRREVRLPFFIGDNFQRQDASLLKREISISNQIWDTTLTYTDSFGDHNLTVLGGISFRDEAVDLLQARGLNFPLSGEEAYFIDQAQTIVEANTFDGGAREYGLSYFGRISYNLDNRYLLYGTFRADGTNKYQEKWGYFPTVGIGWVLSEELFFPEINQINFLKLRGSWGELGNDRVPSSEGSITSTVVTTALGDISYSGLRTNSDFTTLKWEVTEEINIGLSARMFDNALSLELDYFVRDTEDAVIPVERPLIPGATRQNIGKIRNSGFESAFDYSKQVSQEFSYAIGGNVGTLNNEVLDLGGQSFLDAGTAEFRQRSIVGEPIFAFYGREVIGVYQNESQIQADPVAIANELEPGDFIYRDANGDGTINDDDRMVLGSFLPNVTFGLNLGVNYESWDFSASLTGQVGNSILNRKRGEVIFTNDTNWDRDFAVNRWHSEGSTNRYPSAAGIRKSWNQRLNSWFIEDGDFFRIQNITIGYTFNNAGGLENIPPIRIYASAEKPLTVFNYNGFNPEVSDGVDNQTYPIPAVYTFGVNIKI